MTLFKRLLLTCLCTQKSILVFSLMLVMILGNRLPSVAQTLKAEQYLIGTSGSQGNYPGGGNISWTVGEVVVFPGNANGNAILSGIQSYPICYESSNLTILGTSASLCGSVPVVLSVSGIFTSYQWYFTNGSTNSKIVGATAQSYAPVMNGGYFAIVKFLGGFCTFTSPIYNVSLASGVSAPIITHTGDTPNDTLLTSSSASSYEWYVDGRRIVGETNQNYHVLFNGKYQVKIRYPGNCQLISDVYEVVSREYGIVRSNAIITDSTVFFPKHVGFNGLQLHPNPTPDLATLEYYSFSDLVPRIQIFNGEGKLIHEYSAPYVDSIRGFKRFEIDLRSYPRAMYYIKLFEGEDIRVEKLIKY